MAITIDLTGQGDGVFTIEDDGTPGNGTSVVRRPDGTIFAVFVHPADAVTIISRAGQSINVNFTDSLTTANFTIGSLTVPGQNPDNIAIGSLVTSGTVTLAARNAISELGSDAATDITCGKLFLESGTGIGFFNAIETQTGLIEAESVNGGINLSNVGNVIIGGATGTANLRGLFTGASGNITLVNQGSITLSDEDSFETVRSAGNLTLSAVGATADISSNVNQDALLALGNIFLNAGRDVNFGTVGVDFDNDVRAGGSIFINAGRDFHIDGFSDMAANDQGLQTNGGVTITAGRDILIDDVNGSDASVGVSSGSGSVLLTTGIGGSLVLHASSSAAIFAGAGGVTVRADRMLIEPDSGISVTGGGTATLTTASSGRGITLGVATDGLTALELSDAELDRIFAANVVIGGDAAGTLTVEGAITHPNANLTLRSGSDIIINASLTSPNSLVLLSAENIFQAAASTITTSSFTASVDSPDLDPAGGSTTFGGTVNSMTSPSILGAGDADTLRGTNTADTLSGMAGNDSLFGIDGNDMLDGGEGNDFLDGGPGNDTMIGGAGDDIYRVDSSGDTVVEGFGDGNDKIQATVSYALGVAEIETLSVVDHTETTPINLVGNGFANTILGNNGDNFLDGGGGNDILQGFGGNDTYGVDSSGDIVIEANGGGSDVVATTVSYALVDSVFVETLRARDATATAALALVGNSSANTIQGNNGSNFLDGGGGNDILQGFAGDDTYGVDSSTDIVIEAAGGGNDVVASSADFGLADSVFVETLRARDVTATTNLALVGNSQANTLQGNNGNNFLDGGAGADILQGFSGNDTYGVDHGSDLVFENAGGGSDTVATSVSYALAEGQEIETLQARDISSPAALNLTGNSIANTLLGSNGANVLDGRGGNDVMQGFGNADSFQFTTALGAGNVDFIVDMVSGVDKIALEDSIFAGVSVANLGSVFVVGNSAQDADDRIIYNNGQLFYDPDGSGGGAAVLFATLQGAPAISASDFTVI